MGPLKDIKVVEVAGIGPAPFAAMMLADMGADVIRIDRKQPPGANQDEPSAELLNRGRQSVAVDLKHPEGQATVLRLIERADALVEGFRPGVMERLGLGPDVCLGRNPCLVYGRMTGWGQDGPLAHAAGHDINYVALAGALHAIGRRGQAPVPPLNLVGDFGGGGMLLAFGVVCGLLERVGSGRGQVIDAAMVDGAALLMTLFHGMRHMGMWSEERGTNLLDGGAPFYDVYETADGEFVAIGALEPQFYAELLERTGVSDEALGTQMDPGAWPEIRARLRDVFRRKTQAEWCALLEGTDVCFSPVLGMAQSRQHPHMRARGSYLKVAGIPQPAPAPRFSRTPPSPPGPARRSGAGSDEALARWGFEPREITALREAGAIG